ncbi:MAG: hypothetical protein ABWZ78_07685 [Burkholderiaceae bacterium]
MLDPLAFDSRWRVTDRTHRRGLAATIGCRADGAAPSIGPDRPFVAPVLAMLYRAQ